MNAERSATEQITRDETNMSDARPAVPAIHSTKEQPAIHTMQCMEVWGGNEAIDNGISVPGIDAWVYSQPYHAQSGGGDIYYTSMCGAARTARFVLADVAGHGSEVSDLALHLRTILRRNIGTPDQTKFARALNRAFGRLSKNGIFATAAMVTYFAPTDQLITCLAGHPRPLWYHAATGRWQLLSHELPDRVTSSRDFPLGIVHPMEYHQFAVPLGRGDLVVLYSDALIETGGRKDGMGPTTIGEEGLLKIAATLDATDPSQFGRVLSEAVDAEFGRTPETRSDDLTVLVLHHNAADPPPLSLGHKLRMMAKMLGL
jgi:phosphoserine phosphatase RsbU/P